MRISDSGPKRGQPPSSYAEDLDEAPGLIESDKDAELEVERPSDVRNNEPVEGPRDEEELDSHFEE